MFPLKQKQYKINIFKIKFIMFYFKIFIIIALFILLFLVIKRKKKKLKIGIIGVRHEVNIGNNLIKFAISIKLAELGFIPYIIGTHWNNLNKVNSTITLYTL